MTVRAMLAVLTANGYLGWSLMQRLLEKWSMNQCDSYQLPKWDMFDVIAKSREDRNQCTDFVRRLMRDTERKFLPPGKCLAKPMRVYVSNEGGHVEEAESSIDRDLALHWAIGGHLCWGFAKVQCFCEPGRPRRFLITDFLYVITDQFIGDKPDYPPNPIGWHHAGNACDFRVFGTWHVHDYAWTEGERPTQFPGCTLSNGVSLGG
jgi:hypothetical protein